MDVNLDVIKLIPQAPPFVMVDKLLAFSEKSLKAAFTVTASNIFVNNNIFAEAGLIENMAQAVALHTGYEFYLKKKTPPTGYLGAINKVMIVKLPEIGDEIHTKIEIIHEFGGVTLVDVAVFLGDERIATGQMKTVIAA